MTNRPWRRVSLRSALLGAALTLCPLVAPRAAWAFDPLGLYIGAAYGASHIRAQLQSLTLSSTSPLGNFDATHSAYQAMLGLRPISFIGAEITYTDFGQSSFGPAAPGTAAGAPYPTSVRVSQKGEGAFALLYLPVPIIDVYVKGGLARITTDASATYQLPGVGACQINSPNCGTESVRHSSTDTAFAYGAGIQWKLGEWAIRGEYERFSAAGENPTLVSIGMTYWIPWG